MSFGEVLDAGVAAVGCDTVDLLWHADYENDKNSLRLVKRTRFSDFHRDLDKRNCLLEGRFLTRGGIAMFISTTGSGKSVLAYQMALAFNRGVPCCGFIPVRPFKIWIIQSEDDADRLAIDRDDILAHLKSEYPDKDWGQALAQTVFLDFTAKTATEFVMQLDRELDVNPPDAVIINPFNAYFGGDPMSHRDVSAFLKGGDIGRMTTPGLEAVIKRHNVGCVIFAHTPKPPTEKERGQWVNDAYSCYKSCGSSALPDAVRSIATFLKVPDEDGVFVFHAGKNGHALGWTDENGEHTTKAFFRWGDEMRHYWQDVPKGEWADLASKLENGGTRKGAKTKPPAPPQPTKPPPRDETQIVRRVLRNYPDGLTKSQTIAAITDAVNADRRDANKSLSDGAAKYREMGRNEARDLFDLMTVKKVITVRQKGNSQTAGYICTLTEMMDTTPQQETLVGIHADADSRAATTPGSDGFEDAPPMGRSKKWKRSENGKQ